MGSTEGKNMKYGRKNKVNPIAGQSEVKDDIDKPNPISASIQKYEPFDFGINQKFIEENKKLNHNLGRHRHKFAPFTRSQRRKRRIEVYKLHFEHGIPATRIAEMMKVDRNTINNDLKMLYRQALADYSPEDMSLEDIIQKQLLRLETQRDRLSLYLSDTKDINTKVTIERLISDIDFKMFAAIEKINHNSNRLWDEILKNVNKMAEINNVKLRYTSLFELQKISLESRKSLDEIMEKATKENKDTRR